jgi:RHS repeat-associated protein
MNYTHKPMLQTGAGRTRRGRRGRLPALAAQLVLACVGSLAAAAQSAPVLDLAAHHEGMRVPSPFDATVGYSTPAYVSMDVPRSVALAYSGETASPTGFVQVDATDRSSTPPQRMSISLRDASGRLVWLTGGRTENFYASGPGTTRLAAQLDARDLATGAYTYTMVVRSWWGAKYREVSQPVRVLIVNDKDSPFGAGWSVVGLQRLHVQGDGSLVLTQGDGSAAYFAKGACVADEFGNQSCSYISPAGDFTSLNYESLTGQYTRSHPDGTVAVFSASGSPEYLEDRFGNRVSYGYDATGRLGSIQDPAGKTVTFGYDASGKLASIQDPALRSSAFAVNSVGDLTQVTDPDGVTALRASYDGMHRMTQRHDRKGSAWAFAYDVAGRLAADTLPAIRADGQNLRPVVRYRSWEAALLPPRERGTFVNPAARVTPDAARAETTDPKGNVTRMALDRWMVPTRIEKPLGRTTIAARNANGQDTLVTAPSGHQVRYTWSGPNLTKVEDLSIAGKGITIEYETTYNQPTYLWGSTVPVWNYYGTAGRLDSTRVGTSKSPVTKYTYDSRGRVKTVTDPEKHTTTYFHDGNPWLNTDSVKTDSRRTAYTYDGYGRVASTKDPLENVSRAEYDLLNRTLRTIGALNDTTTYGYDALHLASIQDAKKQVYRFGYNALGWVETRTDPRGAVERYAYDKNGNVTTHTNRRSQQVSFTYDQLDQVRSRSADGKTTTYTYDPKGLFVAASNGESTDTLKLDAAGRQVAEAAVRGGKRYEVVSTYDHRDQRTEVEFLDSGLTLGWTEYRWNDFMQLDTLIENGTGGKTPIGYNADRQASTVRLPTFDRYHKLTPTHALGSISYSDAGVNAAAGFGYNHDLLNRAIERRNAAGDTIRSFRYDPLGQLTGYRDYTAKQETVCSDPNDLTTCSTTTTETTLYEESYGYDAVGNRTNRGAIVETGNRLVQFNGYTLEYDADGNLTRKYKKDATGVITFDQSFSWNSLGELVSVTTSGATTTFGYDGFGRRVRKSGPSGTEQHFYDGDQLFAVLDGAGSLKVGYAYYPGVDRPHSVWRGAYFLPDHLGSIVGTASGSSSVSRYRYKPFGETELAEGGLPRFGFTGREYDPETGLYFYRARYYDPTLARFISEDPLGLAGGINPYVYAGNDPVNNRDPFGLECTNTQASRGECAIGLPGVSSAGPDHFADHAAWSGAMAWGTRGRALLAGFVGGVVARRRERLAQQQACGALWDSGSNREAYNAGCIVSGTVPSWITPGGLGRAGEAAAGIVKNTARIPSLTGTAKFRVPDVLNPAVIGEVKNVARLSYTSQLRDFAQFAQSTGRTFDLYVRRTTELSAQLHAAIRSGAINLRFLPW